MARKKNRDRTAPGSPKVRNEQKIERREKVTPWYDRKLVGKNSLQNEYITAIKHSGHVVLASGSAGTGKTYVAACIAADMIEDPSNPIERIIIARPAEGCSKSVGFFKGTANEKMAAWVAPVVETLKKRLGTTMFNFLLDNQLIELLPLETVRGRSFENAFVIVDEAQNIDVDTMKALCTRNGEDSKLVICGDIKQADLRKNDNGLKMLLNLCDNYYLPVSHFNFLPEHIVRSGICKLFVEVFEDAGV